MEYGINTWASPRVITKRAGVHADGLASAHHQTSKEVKAKGENANVTVTVKVEPKGLKRIKEEGKLVAFVDALPLMMAGSIKAAVVEKLAEGELAGASVDFGYVIDDFSTGPKPGPWPGPWENLDVAFTMLSLRAG